jgi:hypothetical protein
MCEPAALDDWCSRCGQITPQLAGFSVLGFPEQGCTVCTRTVDHRWQDAGPLHIPDPI